MTRQRLPPGTILRRAYDVLDKFKINRAFFVKTDQVDCQIAEPATENEVNKQGADAGKVDEDKTKEKENVKSAVGAVSEPVVADVKNQQQQQQPAESKKPAVAAAATVVDSVVQQDQAAASQSDVASNAEVKPAEVSTPVKQTSVVADDAVKKQ